MSLLRDAALVAWFDLRESLRSKRALALIIVYLLGAMAATGVFVEILGEIERAIAEGLFVPATGKPGTMAQSLLDSEAFHEILVSLVKDEAVADELASAPPLGLFYGWVALALAPALAVITSAEAVARERASGSCRFALFRTSRGAWSSGKLAGQALMLAVGLFVGGVGVWIVGAWRMADFRMLDTAVWVLRASARAWIYGFPFLGLALGVSQLTRSVNAARALGLIALVVLAVLGGLSGTDRVQEYAPVLLSSVHTLFPVAHKLELWQPDLSRQLPAAAMLLAQGLLAFAAGHAVFSRQDA